MLNRKRPSPWIPPTQKPSHRLQRLMCDTEPATDCAPATPQPRPAHERHARAVLLGGATQQSSSGSANQPCLPTTEPPESSAGPHGDQRLSAPLEEARGGGILTGPGASLSGLESQGLRARPGAGVWPRPGRRKEAEASDAGELRGAGGRGGMIALGASRDGVDGGCLMGLAHAAAR